jgi:hypothetical protein
VKWHAVSLNLRRLSIEWQAIEAPAARRDVSALGSSQGLYSAEMDHAPFNPISAPAPAAHPVELKFLPPSKDATGVVVPGDWRQDRSRLTLIIFARPSAPALAKDLPD